MRGAEKERERETVMEREKKRDIKRKIASPGLLPKWLQ